MRAFSSIASFKNGSRSGAFRATTIEHGLGLGCGWLGDVGIGAKAIARGQEDRCPTAIYCWRDSSDIFGLSITTSRRVHHSGGETEGRLSGAGANEATCNARKIRRSSGSLAVTQPANKRVVVAPIKSLTTGPSHFTGDYCDKDFSTRPRAAIYAAR